MNDPAANRVIRSSQRRFSLGERLRADDLRIDLPDGDPLAARVNSIRAHLVTLLNARRGLSDSTPGYGLAEFNGIVSGSLDMMRAIARDIQVAITVFEPRVSQVSVSFDRARMGSDELHFQVSVQTAVSNADEQVKIDLVLKNGRSFELR